MSWVLVHESSVDNLFDALIVRPILADADCVERVPSLRVWHEDHYDAVTFVASWVAACRVSHGFDF